MLADQTSHPDSYRTSPVFSCHTGKGHDSKRNSCLRGYSHHDQDISILYKQNVITTYMGRTSHVF